MLSPFPGMNPFLELAGLWQSACKRLMVAIADFLNSQLRLHCHVEIEERVYERLKDRLLVGSGE
ncbi:MAG: DUF4058 family protein [Leptolyngbyaceae cyanobacterium HOT.MB2.61]|jgi:hypothetical protein|nr:DUF4058 family protein [Leptolyngbyaceae cyanobacterium HOT.MB2.61]